MTTPAQVNKQLKKLNIKGSIVRSKAGYYYFIGDLFDVVPAIYSFNLHQNSTEDIINYINQYFKP